MRLYSFTARFVRYAIPLAGAAIAGLLFAALALADAAPPEMPPGSTIGAGARTQVQMRSERVVIDVFTRAMTADDFGLVSDAARARVTGEFFMRNLGKTAERMQVRFPLADPYGMGSGYFEYPQVDGFKVWVDGLPMPTTVVTSANPFDPDWEPVRWAAWDTSFPAGKDVVISVTYGISPTGYFPEARFAYVMSTGAGWRGPIGKADIIARLPYTATKENVVLEKDKTSRGARLAGNEIRWSLKNIEPTKATDIFFTLIAPNRWQAIVDARAAAARAPRDPAKWAALAQAYVGAIPMKYVPTGGAQYVKLALQAMEKAVALQPKSAELHADYAELMLNLYRSEVEENPDGETAQQIRQEAEAALELDPNNEKAREILIELGGSVPVG